ncbi:hypothetical protein MKX01_003509 [Papaver californicum]|nr:hypothetical protein MKX01_003509 [Papaver californicum]
MKRFWFEAILPLGFISGFFVLWVILSITSTNGRQKQIGNHLWDVAMERRDKKLVEKLYAEQN